MPGTIQTVAHIRSVEEQLANLLHALESIWEETPAFTEGEDLNVDQ